MLFCIFLSLPPNSVGEGRHVFGLSHWNVLSCVWSDTVTTVSHELLEQYRWNSQGITTNDDLIRFCRSKVEVTAGLSLWHRRHPHRHWGLKVHVPVDYFAWRSGCKLLWWVCLCVSVCLSVHEDIPGTTCVIFTKLLCMLPMAVARSFSGIVAIILLFLWMTSCFFGIMIHIVVWIFATKDRF